LSCNPASRYRYWIKARTTGEISWPFDERSSPSLR
jgi:hypothetical protein